MRTYVIFATALALGALLACGAHGLAAAELRAASVTNEREKLVADAQELTKNFQSVTEADLDAAKEELLASIGRLETFLRPSSTNGAAWKKYIGLDAVRSELMQEEPDLDVLAKAEDQLSANRVGLELRPFADVREGLRDYLSVELLVHDEEERKLFEEAVRQLSESLSEYAANPTGERAYEIGLTLGQMEAAGRLTPLVTSVRRLYSYPNFHVQVSDAVVSAGIQGPVNEAGPITDCILGTYITGLARTNGITDVQLVPSRSAGVIDITLNGTATSRTKGRNGPATIYSTGTTTLAGRKRTIFDESGLRELPATSDARTRTRVTGIAVSRGGIIGGVIENVARKRVQESKAQAEAIASQRAEARLNQRLDEQAADALVQANRSYRERFVNQLKRQGIYPTQLGVRSTSEFLFVRALEASAEQLAAPTAPIPFATRPDLGVQLHESMANNVAATMLAGRRFTDDELRKRMVDLTGEVPKELQLDPEEEPWSITFANAQPVTVSFRDGEFQVTIRGEEFTSGDRRLPAMNITAVYALSNSDGVIRAVRQGELQIFPPDYDPNGDQPLSVRQQSLRSLLERRFGNIFKPELVGEGLVLPGRWKAAGRLALSSAASRAGWLALGWNRAASR